MKSLSRSFTLSRAVFAAALIVVITGINAGRAEAQQMEFHPEFEIHRSAFHNQNSVNTMSFRPYQSYNQYGSQFNQFNNPREFEIHRSSFGYNNSFNTTRVQPYQNFGWNMSYSNPFMPTQRYFAPQPTYARYQTFQYFTPYRYGGYFPHY